VASRRASSPDGREWTVSVQRMRLPDWHHSNYDPWEDAHDFLSGAFAFLVLAPLFWLILPLVRGVVLLPIAFVRSLFSGTRWIEAVCRDPGEIRIVWRTSRDEADEVAEEITRRLATGYEEITPPKAEFLSMTEPPGARDLSA
jgi:hypothetical protein